jgi:hypothetical protein
MLIFNTDYYRAWLGVEDPLIRYWIRLWQDGLHSGTHPEWTFSPLDIPCLGRFWEVFRAVPGRPDWGRSQRRAIRTLVRRRLLLADGKRFPPPPSDEDPGWGAFWRDVSRDRQELRTHLITVLRSAVCSGQQPTPDYEQIKNETSLLVAELFQKGHSEYELFQRGAGVLDPAARRSQPHVERVRGLLNFLELDSQRDFVVCTEILQLRQTPSKTTARRLAPATLPTPQNSRAGSALVRIDDKAFAITRCFSSHDVSACLRHRFECSELLRQRSAQFGIVGLELATTSQAYLLETSAERPPKRLTRRLTSPFQYLPRPNPDVQPKAFSEAIEAIDDDPVATIRTLCDAFEREFGKDWPETCGMRYRAALRTELSRRLLIALNEARARRRGVEPPWLEAVPEVGEIAFLDVAHSIRASGVHNDELLAQRFEAVGRGDTTYSS